MKERLMSEVARYDQYCDVMEAQLVCFKRSEYHFTSSNFATLISDVQLPFSSATSTEKRLAFALKPKKPQLLNSKRSDVLRLLGMSKWFLPQQQQQTKRVT